MLDSFTFVYVRSVGELHTIFPLFSLQKCSLPLYMLRLWWRVWLGCLVALFVGVLGSSCDRVLAAEKRVWL